MSTILPQGGKRLPGDKSQMECVWADRNNLSLMKARITTRLYYPFK